MDFLYLRCYGTDQIVIAYLFSTLMSNIYLSGGYFDNIMFFKRLMKITQKVPGDCIHPSVSTEWSNAQNMYITIFLISKHYKLLNLEKHLWFSYYIM